MSLTDRIDKAKKQRGLIEKQLKEAREAKWDANFIRKNDERRPAESEQHWHARRARNRIRFENKDKVVDHLVKKLKGYDNLIDTLKDHREEIKAEHRDQYKKGSTRIVFFDGTDVVEDAAYWMQKVREHGATFTCISGYRTPEECTAICIGMCGHPTCPGTCGGASSNHAKKEFPGPAIDVLGWESFEDHAIAIGCPYINRLPLDVNHFSRSGS